MGGKNCPPLPTVVLAVPNLSKAGPRDRFWQFEVVCLYLSLKRQTHFCKKREGSGKLCILAVFCCTVIFWYISV